MQEVLRHQKLVGTYLLAEMYKYRCPVYGFSFIRINDGLRQDLVDATHFSAEHWIVTIASHVFQGLSQLRKGSRQ